ncbi:hypothetical protein [Pinibacter aurantiacus]|uniref:PA14 domain-containing protein n=1 Tax=Pinibacter aurantiacus TaxID=2851599 RepID=A0A9E2SD19_9BACT|nr:hypothetical protein [Pinibacter aurantiacus]MBV4358904.1 hypothetical protein [Pinibacter aurantiacus]
MYNRIRRQKLIAAFFLAVFTVQFMTPLSAYALTSGPTQPEMQKFEPAGTNDLVDLFTGDFKYNIPLMDVGGYPINMSYQSGTGPEDEASWVGAGWSLNPGSMNRTMRGLPDDFSGEKDHIDKVYKKKDFKKIGGQLVIKPSFFSWEYGNASLKVGVYKDNYYGIGAEVGASLGFELAKNKKSSLTAGLGITSDNRQGVSLSPSLSLSAMHDDLTDQNHASLSGSLHYNTRSGLKQLSLSASYSTNDLNSTTFETSAVHYFGQTYTPTFSNNSRSESYTAGLDFGLSLFGQYVGFGLTGYYYKETNTSPFSKVPAYGYLNYLKGRQNTNALLDFNREKDGVFIPSAPSIAIPVSTQDYFTATGQTGSGQYRAYYGGSYTIFDRAYRNQSINAGIGVTLGGGEIYKGGARIDAVSGDAVTGKWVNNNQFLTAAERPSTTDDEPIYFKREGEASRNDVNYINNIGGENTESVAINDLGYVSNATAYAALKSKENGRQNIINGSLAKAGRVPRSYTLSYLTAGEADFALDKMIKSVGDDDIPRADGIRQPNHITEMTVTDDQGKRMVYGIPVYNTTQTEVTFSIDQKSIPDIAKARRTGLVGYTDKDVSTNSLTGNNNGRDNLVSKETTPGYATSFLLTGILSPDYVDVTDDGITDDDLGTAIKFNYKKLNDLYNWRAPFAQNKANYNEGFLSDPKDDKASYSYGKKELWYLKSVESKTMIAIFETSARNDGYGVADEKGGIGTMCAPQKLDRIVLYSKSDYLKNGANATPIKIVHFEYDYSMWPGIPNNKTNVGDVTSGGKLTLKKVYFTFGKNNRGSLNPYLFEYDNTLIKTGDFPTPSDPTDPEFNDLYLERQQDRWGNFKQSWYNHQTDNASSPRLYNSEFPYTLQDNDNTNYDERELENKFVSKWQLNKITTPTGGVINVTYEADDYAFVQNRKAMQMCFVKGIGTNTAAINKSTGLNGADGLLVELPKAITNDDDFKKLYLKNADGSFQDKIFFKMSVDLNKTGKYEYVYGYAEIDINNCKRIDDHTGMVTLKKLDGYNPVCKAAWQMLKSDLPQFAYNNYDNADVGSDWQAALKSLLQSITNLDELVQPFEKSASRKHFADNVDLSRSMVRLNTPAGKKIGGGSRVKKVTLSDEWHGMTHGNTARLGQVYDYTILDENNNKISSGVASYEPQIGNEENPFHEPLNYTEKVHWSADKYHFIEKPFCESYFPAAAVGYSKVTVRSTGADYETNPTDVSETGYIENEFYTAKDFPTLVDYLPLEQKNYTNSLILQLFSATYINKVSTSQGFKVELNDMHGKPKSVKVYDKGGSNISSTEYYYNVKDENAPEKQLNNNVDVMEKDGTVTSNVPLGTDIDFITDVRESVNESIGGSVGIYTGGMAILWFYVPYFSVSINANINRDAYNSVSAVKVIHKSGLLKKVRTVKNGSSITAENMLWDGTTGEVLCTKNQNEYDDYTYSFNYPAYMAYEGMGEAYKNIGARGMLWEMGSGVFAFPYASLSLFPGDMVSYKVTGEKAWVIKSGDGRLRIVTKDGTYHNPYLQQVIVLRSGRRNMLTASAGSVVCTNNPIVNVGGVNRVQIDAGKNILDAKAVTYKDEWAIAVNKFYGSYEAPDVTQCAIDKDCWRNYLFTLMALPADFDASRRKIFSSDDQNLVNETVAHGLCKIDGVDPLYLHYKNLNDDHHEVPGNISTPLKMISGDRASLASFNIVFDVVDDQFNNFLQDNTKNQQERLEELYMWYTENNRDKYILDNDGDCAFVLKKAPCATCDYQPILRFHIVAPTTTKYGCLDPLNNVINPYYKGVLGNWRPEQNFAYVVNRDQTTGNNSINSGTNIRKNGFYTTFNPFWQFQTTGLQDAHSIDNRWVMSNESIYFDEKGNEVENMDALKRYGAALFGYRGSVATAVGVNARRNEIAFDGFEDYNFVLSSTATEQCPLNRHLDWGDLASSGSTVSGTMAHTGKSSLNLNGSVVVKSIAGNAEAPTTSALAYNSQFQYILTANEQALGFAPVNGRKYILNFWVYDNNPNSNKVTGLTLKLNGNTIDFAQKEVPVVEGWKQVEVKFMAQPTFSMEIGGSNLYIDDVRLLPNDGQLTSFVYDPISMRLMAQLDENNFATLYEYDDEGTPIRVKKETERGIMTIKESRQAYKSKTLQP